MRHQGRRRPTTPWLVIRVTALLLAVLVLTHFAMTHLITDVAATDSQFVASRWQSGILAAADWVMLVAAVLHGAAGAWTITDDYALPGMRRTGLRLAIGLLGAAMIAGGTLTLYVVLA